MRRFDRSRATLDLKAQQGRQGGSRRVVFVKWLRTIHGWVGLWGAALGLLFGGTGLLLNHRAGPLEIRTGPPQVERLEVPVPQPAPATPRDLARWLQRELHLSGRIGRVQREPAHRVAWGAHEAMQPERWNVVITSPEHSAQAEYCTGSGTVSVRRSANAACSPR